jgi:ABC-type lipoprotein release transport system permease subunit
MAVSLSPSVRLLFNNVLKQVIYCSTMRLPHLTLHELRYRKLNFILGLLAVAAAVGCCVALLTQLRQHDRLTERLIAEKEKATRDLMFKMEDDLRKITVRMGFNMVIFSRDQDLEEFYAAGWASKTMPEAYGDKLAAAKVATINHVLPALQRKLAWPEYGRTILLTGVRGEVYIQSKTQAPILEAVQPGTLVLGHEIQRSLNLAVGQKVKLMDRDFTVAGVQPGRGNKDDIAVFIPLAEAQQLLGQPGLINAILALECECSDERLAAIRREVAGILPDTQVIEFAPLAAARAQARTRAAAATLEVVKQEKESRGHLRRQRQRLAGILIPTVLIASALWIGLLTFSNVRERAGEIGILRAVGLRSWQILSVFVLKALVMGIAGGGLGYGAGLAGGYFWRESGDVAAGWQPGLMGMSLLGACVLTTLASGGPALWAAGRDPAELLREE